jgi:alpha-galactosidase
MDIDKERLEVVHDLARRYVAEMNVEVGFQKTMSREASLQDADFVINAALVGGHQNQDIRRNIGEKHGYYRGVGLGRYHQLRFFLDVVKDMEEICPDAWLIQCANPVFEGCTLLTRETEIKVVGLCHGHYGALKIAEMLDLDLGKVTFQAPGFNHCIWMTHFLYEGKDAYPLIDEWIETKAEKYWEGWDPEFNETQMSPAAVDMYKMFEAFPIGDTARDGGWWYHSNLETKKRWYGPLGGFDSEAGWNRYLNRLGRRMDEMFQVARDPSASVTEQFPPIKSKEQHIPLIDSLVNDKERSFQVNVPNDGAIHDIPDNVVVEIPGIASGRGIQGVHVGRLPTRLMLHIMIPRMLRMEWILEGFLTGDKNVLLHMLLEDHRTRSLEQAKMLIEDILSLPFNRDIAEHFR